MSLVPDFELGLWNAWILVLSFFLVSLGLSSLIIRVFFTSNKKPAGSSRPHKSSYNEQEKKLSYIATVIFGSFIIYSIFLPLKLGTAWFYAGLSVYSVGVIFGTVAEINFATTPLDKPVTKGVYRISRNPMYLSMDLMVIGVGIASVSWIYLLLAVPYIILDNILVVAEERWCLEKYGDAYREYMNRTPRWIGIPKSEKRD